MTIDTSPRAVTSPVVMDNKNWQEELASMKARQERHSEERGAPSDEARRPSPVTPVTRSLDPARRGKGLPAPPDMAAFAGLAGEAALALDEYTEADPVAVLVCLLAAIGNIVGPDPHWEVSGQRHGMRIWPILVGPTGEGRKGTAWSTASTVLREAAPSWWADCRPSGLSSGEGLIHHVRDQTTKMVRQKEADADTGDDRYEEVVDDEGVDDKRVLIVEQEFARTIKVMGRDANTLSMVLRDAWDAGDLQVMVKNNPYKATNAHVTVIGHITNEELTKYLGGSTETANGFANRFLWISVRRSKKLPDGGTPPPELVQHFAQRLSRVVDFAATAATLTRSAEANSLWRSEYDRLSDARPGVAGAVTGRAEAQTLRLAAIYALLDCSTTITDSHLRSALALWEYSERSVVRIFGGVDPVDLVAEAIHKNLVERGAMTRTQIRDLFQRNAMAKHCEPALERLRVNGDATLAKRHSGGRPTEVWSATPGGHGDSATEETL